MQTAGISTRRISTALTSILFLAGLFLPGCGGSATAPTTGGDATTTAPEAATSTTSPASEEEMKIAAALASLSPEDQAAAKAQKICPVGGGPLGSMGTPVTVMAGERKVFLCCEGCQQEFKDHMDQYLAKLSGAEGEATPEGAPAVVPDSLPEAGAEPASGESGT